MVISSIASDLPLSSTLLASKSKSIRTRGPKLQRVVVLFLLGTAILPLLLVHTRLFSARLFQVNDDTDLSGIRKIGNNKWDNNNNKEKFPSHASQIRDKVREGGFSWSKAPLFPKDMHITNSSQHKIQKMLTKETLTQLQKPSPTDEKNSERKFQQQQQHGMTWSEGCLVPSSPSHEQQQSHNDPVKPPTGLVVLLVMAPNDDISLHDNLKRTCHTIPNQLEYLLIPQGWDMLVVVEEDEIRDWNIQSFVRCWDLVLQQQRQTSNNNTTTTNNMTNNKSPITQTWNNLDGTTLETVTYQYQSMMGGRETTHDDGHGGFSTTTTRPAATVFLASTTVQDPHYIQKDPSILNIPITPRSCQAPKSYIQATRYYTRELLNLGILKEYDYWIKLDTDIIFQKTIPFNLLHDMNVRGALFAHTAEYLPKGSKTCAMGIQEAVLNFTTEMSAEIMTMEKTGHHHHHQQQQHQDWKGSMCTITPEVQRDTDQFYTNFIIGKVEFWQLPWVLKFSNFLNEFPKGFFHYRWTDQIFWHYAMGLFLKGGGGGESSSSSFLHDYVVDYTDLRCMPHTNCWQSSYNFQRFGSNAWHRCDNGGYFLHTKDFRTIVPSIKRNNKDRNDTVIADTTTKALLSHQPQFQSSYLHDCSKKK